MDTSHLTCALRAAHQHHTWCGSLWFSASHTTDHMRFASQPLLAFVAKRAQSAEASLTLYGALSNLPDRSTTFLRAGSINSRLPWAKGPFACPLVLSNTDPLGLMRYPFSLLASFPFSFVRLFPLACSNPTESGAGRHFHPPICTAVTQVHPPLQGEGFPLAFKVAGQGSTQQVP